MATVLLRRILPATRREGGSLLAFLCRTFATFLLLLGGTLTAVAQQTGVGAAAAVVAPTDWWHQASAFMVQPWATIAFLVAGCLLLYHDLLTPKTWDWTGSLGLICVGLVFASQITAGDTGWVGVLLLLVGLAAVLLEIHVFPGYGSAIAGFVLMFAGMFLSLGGTKQAGFALTVTTLLTLVTGIAFLAYLPKSPAWKRLSQQMHQQQAAVTATTALLPSGLVLDEAAALVAPLPGMVGQTGKAVTRLHPSGLADVCGVRLQVVTEGDFLESGTPVVVTQVEGDRVVVEPVAEGASAFGGLTGSSQAA